MNRDGGSAAFRRDSKNPDAARLQQALPISSHPGERSRNLQTVPCDFFSVNQDSPHLPPIGKSANLQPVRQGEEKEVASPDFITSRVVVLLRFPISPCFHAINRDKDVISKKRRFSLISPSFLWIPQWYVRAVTLQATPPGIQFRIATRSVLIRSVLRSLIT